MFSYKLSKAKPSVEGSGLEMKPGEVDGRNWKDPISAGAHLQVYTDALLGVVSSIVGNLRSKGLDKPTINGKVVELLNLMISNGDIDEKLKGYILNEDRVDGGQWEIYSKFRCVDSADRCSAWWKIIDATRNGVSWAPYGSESFKNKMNDREKQLFATLEMAREAYWKAQRQYDNYVEDHAIMTINDIFTKYADIFQRISKDWYDNIMTHHIKPEVERINRRRAEKLAEDGETAERPEEVAS